MPLLYADENFDFPVVQELRDLGVNVLTAQEAGQANRGIPDPDVLAYAISQGRALVTLNRRHFIRLHLQVVHHHGIIVCTRDDDSLALANRIHQAIVNLISLNNVLNPHHAAKVTLVARRALCFRGR
jgi:predicted nuclease of predicted toxin-antitoxin system